MSSRKLKYFLALIICQSMMVSKGSAKERLYLIHGQGSDERIFSKLEIDTGLYDTILLRLPLPERKETMKTYGLRVTKGIDTTEVFSIIGVSFGGMVACEIAEILHPRKTIIISSADCRQNLPARYRFMKRIPIYKLLPPILFKWGAMLVQPIVEPDRRHERRIFKQMLRDKSPRFLKRSTRLIVRWDRNTPPINVVRIHGAEDHTIPCRGKSVKLVVVGGSHMMTLTQPKEISRLVGGILGESN